MRRVFIAVALFGALGVSAVAGGDGLGQRPRRGASGNSMQGGAGAVTADDAFNRANESPLASPWAKREADVNLTSNRVRSPLNTGAVTHTATPASADYYVQAKCYPATTYGAGVCARAITAGYASPQCAYYMLYGGDGTAPSSDVALYRRGPGNCTFNQLGSTVGGVVSAGTTLRLEVQATAIRGYTDGTLRIDVTDSGLPDIGFAGMYLDAVGGPAELDDFEFGTFSSSTRQAAWLPVADLLVWLVSPIPAQAQVRLSSSAGTRVRKVARGSVWDGPFGWVTRPRVPVGLDWAQARADPDGVVVAVRGSEIACQAFDLVSTAPTGARLLKVPDRTSGGRVRPAGIAVEGVTAWGVVREDADGTVIYVVGAEEAVKAVEVEATR